MDKFSKTNAFSNILKFTKEIEEDDEAKQFFRKHENQNNMKIIKSEKYKLIKHLGGLFISFEDLFNIDGLTFDRFQQNTAKIKNFENNDSIVPENNIENIISIYIYFRKEIDIFSDTEIMNQMIDLSNLKANIFSFLEFDKLFNITKKYTVLEMKEKAYKIFEGFNYEEFKPSLYLKEYSRFQEYNNYILMDINMKVWAYNLVLYDEIEKKNLEKGFIIPNSKFFQINPIVNVY